ncbi:MAG: hypothetical protein QXK38_00045 [Candidatus Caldarchaeum sp.]
MRRYGTAVDATGVKVHNRGGWMRELYGPKMRRKIVSLKGDGFKDA